MAALVAGEAGLIVALVHLNFNLIGTVLFFPIRRIRAIPIACANALADAVVRNRMFVAGYVLVVFVLLPLFGLWVFKLFGQ